KRLVRSAQGIRAARMAPHVGKAGREAHAADRLVGMAVHKLPASQALSRGVQLLRSFFQAATAKKQHELFAPVPRDMTLVVSDGCQAAGYYLQDPVAGVMAVAVIDDLE